MFDVLQTAYLSAQDLLAHSRLDILHRRNHPVHEVLRHRDSHVGVAIVKVDGLGNRAYTPAALTIASDSNLR